MSNVEKLHGLVATQMLLIYFITWLSLFIFGTT
jgi:hypothetical protein